MSVTWQAALYGLAVITTVGCALFAWRKKNQAGQESVPPSEWVLSSSPVSSLRCENCDSDEFSVGPFVGTSILLTCFNCGEEYSVSPGAMKRRCFSSANVARWLASSDLALPWFQIWRRADRCRRNG